MAKGKDTAEGVLDETGEGFTWDMTDTEAEDGYPILPKGNYLAVIDNVEYQISKSSGNPMWRETYVITEPEHADKNLKVFNYHVFKPDQMGRVKAFLETIGQSDLAGKKFNPKQIADDALLVGSEVRLRLDIRKSEEYGDSNEVKRIMKPTAGAGAGEGGFNMG